MNPIENLWGILARRVYANSRQFGDVAEINNAWRSIGQETLQSLIDSMPDRIFEVSYEVLTFNILIFDYFCVINILNCV